MNLILLLSVPVLFLIELSYCGKLTRDVIPHHYRISLKPDIDNLTFVGNVLINLELKTNTKEIILNSYDLQIITSSLNGTKVSTSERGHNLHIELSGDHPRGNYVLEISYKGKLSTNGTGLSRQNCNKDPFNYCYMVVNDFEPYDAHKVFPCFDEPFFKATFSISITTPNETYKALSNMPEKSSHKTSSGQMVYEFQTTPVMSTYLVSIAVSNFHSTSMTFEYKGKNMTISIHHWGNESHNIALNTIKHGLDFFTNYTNIMYPLPKLDFIEYDREVGSIATENWGLVTIRCGFLGDKSEFTKYQVNTIVMHEIAHSWFGNIVTNEDFNDLWLNEGFAGFFTTKAILSQSKKQKPVPLRSLISDARTSIMLSDSSEDLISIACRKNSSIELCENETNLFSSIPYDKGLTLLYTFNKIVGDETLQAIIRAYLSKFQYKTANTNDFITVAEEISQMSLRPFFESYLYQNTIPLINVEKMDNGLYVLTQRSSSNFKHLNYKWTIPVIYQTDKINKSEIIWFDASMDQLNISVPNNTEWITFNKEEIGFYYVNYSSSIWDNLIDHMHEIKELRFLLNEATHLYLLGHVNCDIFFKILEKIPIIKYWRNMYMFIDDMSCNLELLKREHKELFNFLDCQMEKNNIDRRRENLDCDVFYEPNKKSIVQCIDRMRNVKLKQCDPKKQR